MVRKNVRSAADLPDGEHYGIITFESIYIPGDERSRTNPGHGYPASTETHSSYCVYETREAWEKDIQEYLKRGKSFVPLVGQKAQIEEKIQVTVRTGT